MLKIQLNKISNRISFVLVISIAVIFIIGTSLKSAGTKNLIWIEAEAADKVVEPLQIVDMEGASNNKGIIAIGNHFKKEGYAKYKFSVDQDGEYIIWGRCFWLNVCTNSFQVCLDNLQFEGLGEDPLTNQWHWVMGPRFKIKKGEHTLYLWNREENSQIDKFLVTADASYVPEGLGTTSSIVEDFEAGIIPKNFTFSNESGWKIVGNGTKGKSLFQAPKPPDNDLFNQVLITHHYEDNYIYSLVFKSNRIQGNSVFVSFNYQDEKNYYNLTIAGKVVKLFEVNNGYKKLIQQKIFENNLISSELSDFSVLRQRNKYYIKSGGKRVFTFTGDPNKIGHIVGFGSSLGGVFFDNVSVGAYDGVSYNQNFHEPDFSAFKERPEISSDYLQNLKKGRRNWWIIDGVWNEISMDGFEEIEGKSNGNQPASIVFGTDYWKNYEMQVATKLNDSGGVGIIFNFQDKNNYSLFRWQRAQSGWKYKLDKIESGNEIHIADTVAPVPRGGLASWYKINLRIKDDSIKVLVGDELTFQKKNKLFKGDGKVGFWSADGHGAYFDDILISSIESLSSPKNSKYVYNLCGVNLDVSTSYSDWVPSSDKAIQLLDIPGSGPVACLNKELFEPSMIYNKKIFKHDFKISSISDNVPGDIDVNYNFSASTHNINSVYRFIISINKITVTKNDQAVFSKTINSSTRGDIEISHFNGRWEIKEDKIRLASFIDKGEWETTKMGVGYSGVGKAKIVMQQVSIENY